MEHTGKDAPGTNVAEEALGASAGARRRWIGSRERASGTGVAFLVTSGRLFSVMSHSVIAGGWRSFQASLPIIYLTAERGHRPAVDDEHRAPLSTAAALTARAVVQR